MKKALLALAAVAMSVSVFAQSTDGNVLLQSVNIAVPGGGTSGGSNGNGTYNVPLYQFGHKGEASFAAGLLPGGVTVGLFLSSNLNTPLATGKMGTTGVGAQYIATPFSQPVTIPGFAPGSTPSLTIRAWTTADQSYAGAQANGGQWGEWQITSPQLGGTPPGGGTPIPTPTLTGWGTIDGAGFALSTPEPTTIALSVLGIGALALMRRRK